MNILFDLDGTLADPFESFSASVFYAYDVHKLPKPEINSLKEYIGPPLHLSLPKMLNTTDEKLVASMMKAYREHHAQHCVTTYTFFEGMEEVLKSLSKKYPLFVATSKPITMTIPIMKHAKLDKYFKGIYGSELSGERSLKGDLIKYILQQEALDSDQCWMIGDRKYDIVGAQANKVRSIGVLWGFGSLEELTAAGADQICEKVPDLLDLFP